MKQVGEKVPRPKKKKNPFKYKGQNRRESVQDLSDITLL